jgi:drug/metabolite transporter (DMT)-like permease
MNATTAAWINGFLGMLIFSASLPATRLAVAAFDPLFLTLARAAIAGAAAGAALLALRQKSPSRGDLASLMIVAIGCVLGFPLLTALALQHMTSAHSLVFIGLLPLTTAVFAVLRGGERPRPGFWIFSTLGAAIIAAFAFAHGGGDTSAGDDLMLAAIVVCGLGYAEGAKLSRTLGGWQVISWALVLSWPAAALSSYLMKPASWSGIGATAWIGLAYVSLFSMLIGFVFWYRGLAQGGVATVGQLQLLQPFFGLALSAILLDEKIGWPLIAVAAAVAGCVAAARKFAGHPVR